MIDFESLDTYKLIKAIVICKESGEYLVDLILDSKINPMLLSSFVGALSLFGKENLGKIEEINVKGLDVDMIVVHKYSLFLVFILDKQVNQDGIRKEADRALDLFYQAYADQIENSIDVCKFEVFKDILLVQISEYFKDQKENIKDFGFFTDAINRLKDKS